jgi:pimeloyl-ACP methyl ester carboxylesterase
LENTKSADGTVIAYDRTGDGPPLIIALGAFCDRKTFVPPASLASRFTVCTYDRRGRGDSGDTQPYSPDLEVADLAAVVSAVADAGNAPFVFGHSSGAALALRAAAHGVPMAALVAYEAPYVIPGTREVAEDPSGRITALVAAGRRADAVRYWMTDVVAAPAEVLPMMENSPAWAGLQALAHTLPYDLALTGDQGIPVDDLAKITVPVLVLGGANSPDWFRRTVEATAAAIPGARLVMLDGQDHGAPPEVLTPVLTDFFLGARSLPDTPRVPLRSMTALRGLRASALGSFRDSRNRLGCGGKAWCRRSRLPAAGWCGSRATR